MVVEILTSDDEQFTSGPCNNIEKLSRQTIGVISKPICYLITISLTLDLLRFVRFGVKIF